MMQLLLEHQNRNKNVIAEYLINEVRGIGGGEGSVLYRQTDHPRADEIHVFVRFEEGYLYLLWRFI